MHLPPSPRRCGEARRLLVALLCLLVLPSAGSDAGVAPKEPQGVRRGLSSGREGALLLNTGMPRWAGGAGIARSGTGATVRGAMVLRGGGVKGSKKVPKVGGKNSFKKDQAKLNDQSESTRCIKLIMNNPLDAQIAREGCASLKTIVVNAERQRRVGQNKCGCKALILALQNHKNNGRVMLEAMQLAANLCHAQPDNPFGMRGWAHTLNQAEIGRNLGIKYVVGGMGVHLGAADIQDAGIRALANLAYNSTLNTDRVVKWGGVPAVVAAMNQHPDDLRVQEGGCLFVWSLLANIENETHITYGLEHTGAPAGGKVHVDLRVAGHVAECGGVAAVVKALDSFGHFTEPEEDDWLNVGEQGCAALWFLSTLPGKLRQSIVDAGAVEVARRVATAQAEIAPARTWAARLLEQLTGESHADLIMEIQVPGIDANKDRMKSAESCVYPHRPYCGCFGWRLPNATEAGEPVLQQKKKKLKKGETGEDGEEGEDDGKVKGFAKAKGEARKLAAQAKKAGKAGHGGGEEDEALRAAEKEVLGNDDEDEAMGDDAGEEEEEGSDSEEGEPMESEDVGTLHGGGKAAAAKMVFGSNSDSDSDSDAGGGPAIKRGANPMNTVVDTSDEDWRDQALLHEAMQKPEFDGGVQKYMAKVGKFIKKDRTAKKERQSFEKRKQKENVYNKEMRKNPLKARKPAHMKQADALLKDQGY